MVTPTVSNIPIEELASLPSFMAPTLSYSRQKIAFYWDKTGQLELYIMGIKPNDEAQQVSKGDLPKTPRSGPVWSRDDKYIFFPKDNDGDEQNNIWRINVETGETEQLTDNPKAQEFPMVVSPDNQTLLVAANLKGQLNIFALNLATKAYTQLTDYAFPTGAFMAGSIVYSPDGSKIVFGTNESPDSGNYDIYIMNADGSEQRKLFSAADGSQDGAADWSKDGRYLAIETDHFGGSRVGVFDMQDESVRWITPEDKTVYSGSFSPDGKRLLTVINEHSTANTQVWDVASGTQVDTELPPGMSFGSDWLDNESFFVNIVTDITRPELRTYHISDGSSDVLLPAAYGSIDPKLFVPLEYISYKSKDGLEIHANLYRPRQIESGKTYPAMVEIHGGPTGQFFRGFDPYAQFLADAGYVVIQPNVRGSTGYGVEFRDMALKDWGGGDLDDIEAAAEYLKNLPEVDAERIGVWGGSYGGYMTFMAVTKKPQLWKAAVAWVGITDLKKLYDSSMEHFKAYFVQQMGLPEENAELWADRSAINFAHQMTSHLFILHGVNDPRCPIEQARIFRDKLVELGKVEGQDFKYVELGEEGHGSASIEQKIRGYKLLLDYFQRHL
jgi:dipeptidyl aminopeptidase/acylaminoacyl peptidase